METDKQPQDDFEYIPNEPDNNEPDAVEIYSKRAIWGFSIFCSTLFGGLMLVYNLRVAGMRAASFQVLLFSIGFTILATLVAQNFPNLNPYLSLISNIIGGSVLTNYFFNKYFPEEDYYPKSIKAPLIIAGLILLMYIFILAYVPGIKEQLGTK